MCDSSSLRSMRVCWFLDEMYMDCWCMLQDLHDDMFDFNFWKLLFLSLALLMMNMMKMMKFHFQKCFDPLECVSYVLHVFVSFCTCIGPPHSTHGILVRPDHFDLHTSPLTGHVLNETQSFIHFERATISKCYSVRFRARPIIQMLHDYFFFPPFIHMLCFIIFFNVSPSLKIHN